MNRLSYFRQNGLAEINAEFQLSLPKIPSEYEVVRWAAQKHFIAYCQAIMPHYQPTRFHQLLADVLQWVYEEVKRGKDVRLMVEVPPRHGKTQLVSRMFPSWVLGKERWPIICASYGSTLAETNSQDARDLVSSEMYKYIFQKTRLHPDSTSKQFWRTTKGGSYRAAGVGSALTGMGGKLLICDDPFKDRADADSEVIREATWKWWQSVFMTRREGKTGVIVLNTRWHLDDLTGRLLEQDEDGEWIRIRFPAIAEEDEYVDGQLWRKEGESLWPEKFPIEDLLHTKARTDVYEWSSLYQQNPILNENQEFKPEWFSSFDPSDQDVTDMDIYVLVDLAISQKKSADNTSIQVVGKYRDKPDLYVLEEKTGRFDPGTTIDHIFMLRNQYKGNRFRLGVETIGFQKSMLYSIRDEMRKREVYFDIEEVKGSKNSKEDRIRGLIPLYKMGLVHHARGACKGLEDELMSFPKGRHDDRIDALSFFLQVAKQTSYNQNRKRYVPKNSTYR